MHPLDFLKFEPDHIVFIDFETAYDPKSGYTLSKIPAVEYIRSPLFEVIGVGVQVDDEPAEWLEEHEFRAFASAMDWSKCTVVGHNLGGFDALIMAFRYGIVAGAWVDTLPMARAKHGTTIGNSLKKLMDYYQVGQKGDEVIRAQGKRRKDFTSSEYEAYGRYCCLRGDVPVVMADGQSVEIDDLVIHKNKGKVMSFNEQSGKMEPRRIVGWHATRSVGQEWVRLKTTKRRGMVVTPEHKVLVEHRGWVQARDVRPGDMLLLPEERLSIDRSHALMGTLLGDSTISVAPAYRGRGRAPKAFISGVHKKSSRLAQEKVRLLGSVAALGVTIPAQHIVVDGRHGEAEAAQHWTTKSKAQFAPWREALHPGGCKKRIPLSFVKEMGPVGWAWWFMDDGCVQKGTKKRRYDGSRGGPWRHGRDHLEDSVCISTQCFPRDDIDAVVGWFRERFGATTAGRDKVVRLGRPASRKFCAEIAPYILPAQRYKLPRGHKWAPYRDFGTRNTREPVRVPVLEAGPWVPRKADQKRTRSNTRYCIDVEGNHNFFTVHGLVHNCIDVGGARDLLPLLADGFPELEFWAVDATVRMATEPRFILDEPFLEEYLIYERKRKADLMRSIAGLPESASDEEVAVKVKPVLMSNEKFARLLLYLGVVPPKKISVAKTKLAGEKVLTWAFAKSDPGIQALLEHSNDDVRMVVEARVGVKSTINESRTVRMLRMGKDGQTLPVTLNCYAAHTGRWGGAGKTNMQNLERVNPKKPRSGALRKAMLAPPGHKVIVVDSAAIEARGTAWLAEDDNLVAQFAADVDVYSKFASLIFRRPISKKDKQERSLGKVSILGLGYGMGWAKFSMVLAAGPMGNDPILFDESTVSDMGADIREFLRNDKKMARVEDIPSRMPGKESARIACKALAGMRINDRAVHCAVAEYVVNLYRQENSKIVELWETMNGVLEAMMEDEEYSFGPGGVFTTERHAIRLPSGRKLQYPGLEEDDGRFSYLGDHRQRVGSWGGALTENLVQAFCRDVVTEQMLHVQAKGFRARLMAHDEVVLVEPDAVAPKALACLVAAMKVAPDWAVGLPVSSEGGVGDSYGGSKA